MKSIILAAGFAKRLYPLTENLPKALLKVNNKPILEHILRKIEEIGTETLIVTNNKFYNQFCQWGENRLNGGKLKIINDGVNSEEEKLGAIGDLLFAIDNEKINEDIFVTSGDSLFKFYLKEPYHLFKNEKKDLSILYDVRNIEEAKRLGVALVKDNIITEFFEKPAFPKSTLCSTCMYFFKRDTIEIMRNFSKEKNKSDQPGLFLEYLCKQVPVYGYVAKDIYIDIGTKEALEVAKKKF